MVIPFYCEDYPEDPSLLGVEEGKETLADSETEELVPANIRRGHEEKCGTASCVNGVWGEDGVNPLPKIP